jgi:hypothetical protein
VKIQVSHVAFGNICRTLCGSPGFGRFLIATPPQETASRRDSSAIDTGFIMRDDDGRDPLTTAD